MSWNINLKLNNLQNQINDIANKGLTNPLEQVLNANSYNLENLNILDGGNNVLELKTNNILGIKFDNNVNIDGNLNVNNDITGNIIHYTQLDPPISTSGITYSLIGSNTSQPNSSTILMGHADPKVGFYSNQNITFPTATVDLDFQDSSSLSNSVFFGFSDIYQSSTVKYGIFWYPSQHLIYQIINGNQGVYITSSYTSLNIILKLFNTQLRTYINGTEILTFRQTLSEPSFYLCCSGYVLDGIILTASLLNFISNQSDTLSQVLTYGNDATNQDIINVNNLTLNTLHYTNLDPPIPKTTSTLSDILQNGNNANNQDISGVNNLTCTNLHYTSLTPMPVYIYKQYFTNLNINISSLQVYTYLFNLPIQNTDIKTLELFINNINIQMTSTSFVSNLTAYFYISNQPASTFINNSNLYNYFSFVPSKNNTFTSTVPILLYYNSSQCFNLYFNVYLSSININPISLLINMSGMASGYISQVNNNTIFVNK